MKTCLFIGRFQPFHNGHLMVVKGMVKTCEKVVIVIGSSQESGTDKNPYTAEERKDMLQRALQGVDIIPQFDIEIREVPDNPDDNTWTEQVMAECGPIETVWSGDEWTIKCFKDKGVEVREIKEVPGISATEIRQKIAKGDASWKEQVPPEVAQMVGSELGGADRIQS